MSKLKIFTVLALVIGLVSVFVGKYLQKTYGLDPPYEYYFAGALLELFGSGSLILGTISFLLFLYFNRKSALK